MHLLDDEISEYFVLHFLQIAKEARECIQECVSEFISFITSEASERCQNEKRKTINGEDILYAMCTLGFDNYVDPLTLYLHKYRETTKTDRNISSADVSFEESATTDFSEFVISIVSFLLCGIFCTILLGYENCIDFNEMNLKLFLCVTDQSNIRNGIAGSTSNNSNATTILSMNGPSVTANSIASSAGGVVLGQIGESILYYQNDQNQSFQL